MTRGELLLWPRINRWGEVRRAALINHVNMSTTLFPDEDTCAVWAEIMTESRSSGRVIAPADGWIAAAARQWEIPLVTADYKDFEHIESLTLIPIQQ